MECRDIFEKWKENPNKLSLELNYLSHNFLGNAPQFFEGMIDEIESRSEHQPDEAFADLLCITAFSNFLANKKPDILGGLIIFYSKIKNILGKIAENKLADSYSISSCYPSGVCVSLSWNTKQK